MIDPSKAEAAPPGPRLLPGGTELAGPLCAPAPASPPGGAPAARRAARRARRRRAPNNAGAGEERLLTADEVAGLYRVDPKTVTRWAAGGWAPAVKTPGGHWRFRPAGVAQDLGAPVTQPGPRP